MAKEAPVSGITATPKTPVPMHGAKRWNYLTREKTIRVATTDEDGSIYLSPLWFVVDNKRIFIPIDAAGKHGANADSGRPLAALVDSGEDFATVRGVRIVGKMVVVKDAALKQRIKSLLFEKYFGVGDPFADSYFEMGDARDRKFYELVPDKIVGWDAREIAIPPAPEARVLPDFVKDRLVR